ncbi:unnamed protein product [Eruca vesicaria subsp. sativa]|uniref:Uncharacterized protein n=1 Tax=Eruca vesicaria subsp. sativa TaxID=29727 RepID=A0ABC8J2V9_ERUVS|nr:unnamed protein product [Eruca vesicaria subsp. sativa]
MWTDPELLSHMVSVSSKLYLGLHFETLAYMNRCSCVLYVRTTMLEIIQFSSTVSKERYNRLSCGMLERKVQN